MNHLGEHIILFQQFYFHCFIFPSIEIMPSSCPESKLSDKYVTKLLHLNQAVIYLPHYMCEMHHIQLFGIDFGEETIATSTDTMPQKVRIEDLA